MACPSLLAGECSWELWFDQLLCWVSKEQLGWENVICSTLFVTLRSFPQQQKLLNRVGHDILTEEVFSTRKCWFNAKVLGRMIWCWWYFGLKKIRENLKNVLEGRGFFFFKPVTFPPGSFRTRKQDYHLFLFYFGTSGWIPSSSPFFFCLFIVDTFMKRL